MIKLLLSGNRHAPLIKRTDPQIPIVVSSDQVPTQIEQVTDSCMNSQKSLSLPDRFEAAHPSFPHSGRLMRLLSPIVLILLSAMDRAWYQLSMGYPIAE